MGQSYDNLITCDIICGCVSSPEVYRTYIEYLNNKYQSNVISVNFKDKRAGWRGKAIAVKFESGEEYLNSILDDDYCVSFHSRFNIRPSCFNCKYRNLRRGADFTLGDFGVIEQYKPEFDDNKGTSFVITNTSKADAIIKELDINIHLMDINYDEYSNKYNWCMHRNPWPMPDGERKQFYDDVKSMSFNEMAMKDLETIRKKHVNKRNLKQNNVNMSKKVIIIGGEGNGGVIASCIEDNRYRYNDLEWEVAGFLNDYETEVDGFPVIGKLCDIQKFIDETDYYFSWGIHLVASNYKTVEMFREANIPTERLATIIHKSAFIGKGAIIEPGAFIMYNTYIGPQAHIGKCSLIMANCSIGHDTTIGDLCHCSVSTIMTGYSKLGLCSDLGVGACLLAYKVVGDYGMLGASSLGTKDIPEGEIWVGSPAKLLKTMPKE